MLLHVTMDPRTKFYFGVNDLAIWVAALDRPYPIHDLLGD
jgi:hypothetical protein